MLRLQRLVRQNVVHYRGRVLPAAHDRGHDENFLSDLSLRRCPSQRAIALRLVVPGADDANLGIGVQRAPARQRARHLVCLGHHLQHRQVLRYRREVRLRLPPVVGEAGSR